MKVERFDVDLFGQLIVIGVLFEPGKSPKNPKKPKPQSYKRPVVMFVNVPSQFSRQYPSSSDLPNELRCEAAVRSLTAYPDNHFSFSRCARKKQDGECLCAQHCSIVAARGIAEWSDDFIYST